MVSAAMIRAVSRVDLVAAKRLLKQELTRVEGIASIGSSFAVAGEVFQRPAAAPRGRRALPVHLHGWKALVTGGDSGIGRVVCLAFAREGADLCISYLEEQEDAEETKRLVEEAGRKVLLVVGDIADPGFCRRLVSDAVNGLGGLDILVNNAAHQASFKTLEDISDGEWEHTFQVNIHAMFFLAKAAVPHMKAGSAIINTASINSDQPNPTLLAYATTKGAIHNFTAGLAQLLGPRGIRVNAVAPGPIWTPLIPSTLPADAVADFGKSVPLGRPGQPAELATAFVMLADPRSS